MDSKDSADGLFKRKAKPNLDSSLTDSDPDQLDLNNKAFASSSDTSEEEAENPLELPPSVIGTKDYWNKAFANEMNNFDLDSLEGDVWFGNGVQQKMLRTIMNETRVGRNDPIVDIGCGNGILLSHFAYRGYTKLVGVDFSEAAGFFCNMRWQLEGLSMISFKNVDMLEEVPAECLSGYTVCLDKGTYDTVSIMPDRDQKQVRELYLTNVHMMLKVDGFFLIASCNWTVEELATHCEQWFNLIQVVPTPTFSFGGQHGRTVSILLFQRIEPTIPEDRLSLKRGESEMNDFHVKPDISQDRVVEIVDLTSSFTYTTKAESDRSSSDDDDFHIYI